MILKNRGSGFVLLGKVERKHLSNLKLDGLVGFARLDSVIFLSVYDGPHGAVRIPEV